MRYAAIILGPVLCLVTTILVGQYAMRWLFAYRIGETRLEIALFRRIVVWRLPFDTIAGVRRVSFLETLPFGSADTLFAVRLGNRVWGECVLITLKRGFPRAVLVSPDDADRFVSEARKKLAQSP
ncbi:MAG TPA: hypothetical protein VFP50_13650 [Anaeromyxobacteraceae bacterium]|nr:hypothetical protein [Anaeromyxobacteraceae bacterium]